MAKLPYMTSRREVFTLWMKSLVFHGNGCTVFDSNGEIVYRIDNYNTKCSREVQLMDLRGTVLFSIRQKKLRVFGHWDGYKWSESSVPKKENIIPSFQVRKNGNLLLKGDGKYEVSVGDQSSSDEAAGCGGGRYRMVSSSSSSPPAAGKWGLKIVDGNGRLVAEVKGKESSTGVSLGEDVLSLIVEPHVDHSLVMALVTVYALIRHKL